MSETVEVSKTELDTLRRAYGLLDKLWNDPKQGMQIKKAAKEAVPSLHVPDLELVSQVSSANEAKFKELEDNNKQLTERLEKFQSELREKDEDTRLRDSIGKVRKDFGLTDEGLDKVVSLMKERNLGDVEAAAALWSRQQPAPTKPVTAPNYLPASLDITKQFGPEEEWKQWLADPMKKFDNVVAEVIAENAA
jgi:hypothetical protein